MKLSIIICTKNRFNSLKALLEYIFKNKFFKDFEVIVIDGNSTDQTKVFCQELYLHKAIKYANNDGNHVDARNKGLNIATGEYVCFIDDDDSFSENKFIEQVTFLDNNPKIDVVSCTTLFRKDTGLIGSFKELNHKEIKESLKTMTIEEVCNFHSCMFRKSTLDKLFKSNAKPVYFYEEFKDGFEGSGLLYTLWFSGCQFANLNNCCTIYSLGLHPTSLSNTITPQYYLDNLTGVSNLKKKKFIINLYNSYKYENGVE